MKLELSERSISFLYKIFFQPTLLTGEREAYRSSDLLATEEVAALVRWMRTKVIKIKIEAGGEKHEWIGGWAGTLKEAALRRLKHMVTYHAKSGGMVQYAEAYVELVAALDGKTFDLEVEEKA